MVDVVRNNPTKADQVLSKLSKPDKIFLDGAGKDVTDAARKVIRAIQNPKTDEDKELRNRIIRLHNNSDIKEEDAKARTKNIIFEKALGLSDEKQTYKSRAELDNRFTDLVQERTALKKDQEKLAEKLKNNTWSNGIEKGEVQDKKNAADARIAKIEDNLKGVMKEYEQLWNASNPSRLRGEWHTFDDGETRYTPNSFEEALALREEHKAKGEFKGRVTASDGSHTNLIVTDPQKPNERIRLSVLPPESKVDSKLYDPDKGILAGRPLPEAEKLETIKSRLPADAAKQNKEDQIRKAAAVDFPSLEKAMKRSHQNFIHSERGISVAETQALISGGAEGLRKYYGSAQYQSYVKGLENEALGGHNQSASNVPVKRGKQLVENMLREQRKMPYHFQVRATGDLQVLLDLADDNRRMQLADQFNQWNPQSKIPLSTVESMGLRAKMLLGQLGRMDPAEAHFVLNQFYTHNGSPNRLSELYQRFKVPYFPDKNTDPNAWTPSAIDPARLQAWKDDDANVKAWMDNWFQNDRKRIAEGLKTLLGDPSELESYLDGVRKGGPQSETGQHWQRWHDWLSKPENFAVLPPDINKELVRAVFDIKQ